MKSLMLTPAALVLVLAPSLACAQLNTPLTRAQTGHFAAEAAGSARDQPRPQTPSVRQPESVHIPPVALAETDDLHYPDPPFSAPAHPWLTRTTIGVSTEALMQAQINGTHAGPPLPTLGAAAGLSYQRYLKSFTNPLPEMFRETVETRK